MSEKGQSRFYGSLYSPLYSPVKSSLCGCSWGDHVCILRLYKVIGTQPQPLLWLAEMGEFGRGGSLCCEGRQTEEPVRDMLVPACVRDDDG